MFTCNPKDSIDKQTFDVSYMFSLFFFVILAEQKNKIETYSS